MKIINECMKVNAIKTISNIIGDCYMVDIEDQYKVNDIIKYGLLTLYINKNKL